MIVVYENLPPKIRGATVRSYEDGEEWYTIILNQSLDIESQRSAYEHEMRHIRREDFDGEDVNEVEIR